MNRWTGIGGTGCGFAGHRERGPRAGCWFRTEPSHRLPSSRFTMSRRRRWGWAKRIGTSHCNWCVKVLSVSPSAPPRPATRRPTRCIIPTSITRLCSRSRCSPAQRRMRGMPCQSNRRWIRSGLESRVTPSGASGRCSRPACSTNLPVRLGQTRGSSFRMIDPASTTGSLGIWDGILARGESVDS